MGAVFDRVGCVEGACKVWVEFEVVDGRGAVLISEFELLRMTGVAEERSEGNAVSSPSANSSNWCSASVSYCSIRVAVFCAVFWACVDSPISCLRCSIND